MSHWTTERIDNLCNISSGGTPSRNNTRYWMNGAIPWVKIGDIKGMYVNSCGEFITQEGLENSSAKLFRKGTILFSIFASLGEVAIFNIDATTHQAIARIEIKEQGRLDSKFLFYFLKSIKTDILLKGRGVAQNNINLSILREYPIPLPPIDTQRKIAAILDKAQELIDLRKAQIEKLDDFLRSVFLDMFGDPVTNPKGWDRNKLETAVKVIGGYAFPSEYFVQTGIPLIKIGTVNKGYFDVTTLSYWPLDYVHKLRKYEVYPGDLLITLTGTVGKEDYGNVCIAPNIFEKYLLNQRVAKLELNHALCSQYLVYCLRHEKMKRSLTSVSRGVRQANISNNDIYELEMSIPPIPLQQQFAAIVEKTEQQKALMQQSLTEMDNNFNSLMQRAFRGELF